MFILDFDPFSLWPLFHDQLQKNLPLINIKSKNIVQEKILSSFPCTKLSFTSFMSQIEDIDSDILFHICLLSADDLEQFRQKSKQHLVNWLGKLQNQQIKVIIHIVARNNINLNKAVTEKLRIDYKDCLVAVLKLGNLADGWKEIVDILGEAVCSSVNKEIKKLYNEISDINKNDINSQDNLKNLFNLNVKVIEIFESTGLIDKAILQITELETIINDVENCKDDESCSENDISDDLETFLKIIKIKCESSNILTDLKLFLFLKKVILKFDSNDQKDVCKISKLFLSRSMLKIEHKQKFCQLILKNCTKESFEKAELLYYHFKQTYEYSHLSIDNVKLQFESLIDIFKNLGYLRRVVIIKVELAEFLIKNSLYSDALTVLESVTISNTNFHCQKRLINDLIACYHFMDMKKNLLICYLKLIDLGIEPNENFNFFLKTLKKWTKEGKMETVPFVINNQGFVKIESLEQIKVNFLNLYLYWSLNKTIKVSIKFLDENETYIAKGLAHLKYGRNTIILRIKNGNISIGKSFSCKVIIDAKEFKIVQSISMKIKINMELVTPKCRFIWPNVIMSKHIYLVMEVESSLMPCFVKMHFLLDDIVKQTICFLKSTNKSRIFISFEIENEVMLSANGILLFNNSSIDFKVDPIKLCNPIQKSIMENSNQRYIRFTDNLFFESLKFQNENFMNGRLKERDKIFTCLDYETLLIMSRNTNYQRLKKIILNSNNIIENSNMHKEILISNTDTNRMPKNSSFWYEFE